MPIQHVCTVATCIANSLWLQKPTKLTYKTVHISQSLHKYYHACIKQLLAMYMYICTYICLSCPVQLVAHGAYYNHKSRQEYYHVCCLEAEIVEVVICCAIWRSIL